MATKKKNDQPTIVDVTLTEKQAGMLMQAQGAADQAQQKVNLTLAVILAGEDIDTGKIAGYDSETRTLSVELPSEEDDD